MSRTYHHLYHRVEYPMENGYRMEPFPLSDWIHICITDIGDSKVLTVHSRIHVNKEVQVGPSYSSDFSDKEIIKDQSANVYNRFIK